MNVFSYAGYEQRFVGGLEDLGNGLIRVGNDLTKAAKTQAAAQIVIELKDSIKEEDIELRKLAIAYLQVRFERKD